MKKFNYFILFFLFAFLSHVICFEDKESVRKRQKFYENITKVSNSTIRVGADPVKGLYCQANDNIEYGKKVLKVHKRLSLCPYSLFPFKFELIKYLQEAPGLNETLGHEQKFSVYVLTYYVLYYMFAPKERVYNYILENKLEQYYNLTDIDESLKESFPKIMLNSAVLENEHYELLQKLGYPIDKGTELENLFNHISSRFYTSEHFDIVYPWISNFDQFKWAYAIIMSRGMTLRMGEYSILENIREASKFYTKWENKNLKVNKYISRETGVPCIIAYIDLCNHYQPKYADGRDKRPIILDTTNEYYVNSVQQNYKIDDEVSYTYTHEPSNVVMFLHYGFVIRNNIFNLIKLKVEDDTTFTVAQFNLCKSLGCLESNIRDPRSVPKQRFPMIRINTEDESLINYGRVKYLKGDFVHSNIVKLIKNEKIISYSNEMNAWLFYYNTCLTTYKYEKKPITRSINAAQKYRNLLSALQSKWKDKEMQRAEWRNLKTYENIYTMDISYKMIIMKHMEVSVNHLILNTHLELENLKLKYLS